MDPPGWTWNPSGRASTADAEPVCRANVRTGSTADASSSLRNERRLVCPGLIGGDGGGGELDLWDMEVDAVLLRQHERVERRAAAHHDVLPAVELVGNRRIAD